MLKKLAYRVGESIRHFGVMPFILVCLFFAILNTVGQAYRLHGHLSALIASPAATLRALLSYATLGAVIFGSLVTFSEWPRDTARPKQSIKSTEAKTGALFLIAAGTCFVCWLPWFIAFFPASTTHDGLRELQSFYGMIPWTNQHPILPTIIMGLVTQLGFALTKSNTGAIAFYMGLYYLLQTFTCALITVEVAKISRSRVAYALTIIFFAASPFFGASAQTLWKDNLYMCFFALFSLLFWRVLNERPKTQRKRLVAIGMMTACAFLSMGTRKEAVVAIAGILLLGALLVHRSRKLLVVSAVASLIAYGAWQVIATPALGVKNGPAAETLAVPLQSIARTLKYHSQDISQSEYDAFSLCVEDISSFPAVYNPNLSDPLKNQFLDDSLGTFLSTWIPFAATHPFRVFDSYLASSYGYWYVGEFPTVWPIIVTFTEQELTYVFPYEYESSLSNLRETLQKISDAYINNPITRIFVSAGCYTWMIVFCSLITLRNRNYAALSLIAPLLFTVLIASISPANGYLRFFFNIVALSPLLLALTMSKGRRKHQAYAPVLQFSEVNHTPRSDSEVSS